MYVALSIVMYIGVYIDICIDIHIYIQIYIYVYIYIYIHVYVICLSVKHRPQTNNHNTQTPTHTRAHTHYNTYHTYGTHILLTHTHTRATHITNTPQYPSRQGKGFICSHPEWILQFDLCPQHHPGMDFVAPHLNCKIVASTPIFAIAHGGPPPANHKPMTGGFDLPITTPPPNYKIHQLSLSRNSPLLSRNSPLGLKGAS